MQIKDFNLVSQGGGGTISYNADFWDTVRGFWSATATHSWAGYTNIPTGTLQLGSAGLAERDIKQWSGAAFTDFKLTSINGFKSNLYDTLQPNISSGASTDRWFQNLDAGDYLDYIQSTDTLAYVNNGNARWYISPARLSVWQSRTNEPIAGVTYRNNGGNASTFSQIYNEVQNELGVATTSEHRNNKTDGSSEIAWYITPPGSRSSDRRGFELQLKAGAINGAGRLIVGGLADDGVHALQAKSLKIEGATNPFAYIDLVTVANFTSSALASLPFNGTVVQHGGAFSNGTFTATSNGFVKVSAAQCRYTLNSGTVTAVEMRLNRNGVNQSPSHTITTTSSSFECVVAVGANDQIKLFGAVAGSSPNINWILIGINFEML